MALNTYQVVAIFVSILGAAIIFAITWLLYKWARASHPRSGSDARRSSRPAHLNPQPNTNPHVANSRSPGPPTQRLMVHHGRVVPQRKSASIRSALSSVHYSGWLASAPQTRDRHASYRSNYSDTTSIYSRASRRSGRWPYSRHRPRPSDVESAAARSVVPEVPAVPNLPELSGDSAQSAPHSKQPPVRQTAGLAPCYPPVPTLQAPPQTSSQRMHSQLPPRHFSPPSIPSGPSSVSTSPAASLFPRNVQPGDSPPLSPSPKRATFTEGSVTPPTPRRPALLSLAMERPSYPRASMPTHMPSTTTQPLRPFGAPAPGSPNSLQSKFYVPPLAGPSKLARASAAAAVQTTPQQLYELSDDSDASTAMRHHSRPPRTPRQA